MTTTVRSPRLPTLVPMVNAGGRTPLIFLPDLGNNLLYSKKLVGALPSGLAVFGMRLDRALIVRLDKLGLEDIAASFAADLIRSDIAPPYRLIGHSFAGILAFETAAQLERLGESRTQVYLLDAGLAANCAWKKHPRHWPAAIAYDFKYMIQRGRDRWREYRGGSGATRFLHAKNFLRMDLAVHPPVYQTIISNLYRAMTEFKPSGFSGEVVLFRAMHRSLFAWPDKDLGWQHFCSCPLEVLHIDCNHLDIVRDEMVAAHVAGLLTGILSCTEAAKPRPRR